MKTLLLFLLLSVPLLADEAPVIIRLAPGFFVVDEGGGVEMFGGWALVSIEVTNAGLEPLLWGDHSYSSRGVLGGCSLDFFLGNEYPICREFTGEEFSVLPGETTYIPFMYLYASDWVEPGFTWNEDIFLHTNTGTIYQASFTGLVWQPDPNIYSVQTPEPAMVLLMLTGLAGLGIKLRRAQCANN